MKSLKSIVRSIDFVVIIKLLLVYLYLDLLLVLLVFVVDSSCSLEISSLDFTLHNRVVT